MFREFKLHDSLSLIFPFLITELCKRAELEEAPKDNGVSPRAPIIPLKVRGDGTTTKSKRRKVDSGKSLSVEESSTRPSMVGPFESLGNDLRVVRDLVKKLPQGPGDPFGERHSFVPQKSLMFT